MNNRRFNNVRWDDDKIELAKEYLQGNAVILSDKTKQLFNDFSLTDDGDLQLNDTGQLVVPPDKKTEKIKEIYQEFGLGSGIKNLYEKVSRRYLDITRKDIQNFLQNQETYQLAKKPLVMIGKTITYSKPNSVWSADLIDLNPFLSSNHNYRYILSITDNFSRFVMLYALKHKEGLDVY
jgi:hypothetical protein